MAREFLDLDAAEFSRAYCGVIDPSNGRELTPEMKDRLKFLALFYEHIVGPPGGGLPGTFTVPRAGSAPLPPASFRCFCGMPIH